MLWSRIVNQRSPFPGYNMYASHLKNARRTEDLRCFITCLIEGNRYVPHNQITSPQTSVMPLGACLRQADDIGMTFKLTFRL